MQHYLKSAKQQFAYYKLLAERTFQQLSDEDLHWQYNSASNSIAVIVNHLAGNMRSRWTDFLTTDGEKEWRQRDQEFEALLRTRAEVMQAWEAGWNGVFDALDSITVEQYETVVYIRNQAHRIEEAINRQLCHYASHIGQIVYIGRMLKGDDWQSLSIPKGQSDTFNADKFGKGKHGGHFTDDFK